ncbi:hypothetical protein ACHAWF_009493, partial [Thalassiosira exigua]
KTATFATLSVGHHIRGSDLRPIALALALLLGSEHSDRGAQAQATTSIAPDGRSSTMDAADPGRRSRKRRRGRRRAEAAAPTAVGGEGGVVVLDLDDSDSHRDDLDDEVQVVDGGAKVDPCIALLDSSDDEVEEAGESTERGSGRGGSDSSAARRPEGRSERRKRRKGDGNSSEAAAKRRVSDEGKAEEASVASDRALAERLQREEERSAAAARRGADDARRGAANSYGRRNGQRETGRRRREQGREREADAAVRGLRAEQDREYEESLLADQIREVERQEVEEQERRSKEEAKEREESERMEEQLEAAKRESALDDACAAAERLEEPPLGGVVATCLRFALPDGKKVDRRFRVTDTVGDVRSFVLVHCHDRGLEMGKVGLATSFPKREFGEGDTRTTLEEAGLVPRAAVMVIDRSA